MVFSSEIFLFIFLPVVLLLSLWMTTKWQNYLLFFFSLLFYSWGESKYVFILLTSIALNYACGLLIAKGKGSRKRTALIVGVVLNLGLLIAHKYLGFIFQNIDFLTQLFNVRVVPLTEMHLPIGISFFTFQGISYIVDVYRDEKIVQRKFGHLGLYIALFPQLIAGPIVRYHDIARQIQSRIRTAALFSSGVERFAMGLAKKVLIANFFGEIADTVFSADIGATSTDLAWLGIISYSIQIYFDFSGYSDMAIGIGRMFGFRILENFNFPYISKSIREFWQRWHISLSNWFRDYLYIPLGGNRKGNRRTYINLWLVFLITGLWHGASNNFIIWGLLHGLFMVLERWWLGGLLDRLWKPIRHLYTLLVVVVAWVFFRIEVFDDALAYLKVMFVPSQQRSWQSLYYLDTEFVLFFVVAIIASTGLLRHFLINYWKWVRIKTQTSGKALVLISYQVRYLFVISSLALAVLYIASGSYNPFIYFKF
jgi:alginate O-acetyltransferase complex protein AlgI